MNEIGDYRFYDTRTEMNRLAARQISEFISYTLEKKERFSMVLAGGGTPRAVYELLAIDPTICWDKVHLFWGDERFVPLDDARSNFNMVRESLLIGVHFSLENIHPVNVDLETVEAAAENYELRIRNFFDEQVLIPEFDLVILGLGSDGHTASLFPGTAALEETSRLITIVETPGLPPKVPRVTMTFPLINKAKKVIFLVSGEEKQAVINYITHHEGKFPASMIQPDSKDLIWYVSGT